MSENKPVIIRKRNRKTREVYAYIWKREAEIRKRKEEKRQQEINAIADNLERDYSYREILTRLAEHLYDEEMRLRKAAYRAWQGEHQYPTSGNEDRDFDTELLRLLRSDHNFIGGDYDGSSRFAIALHEVALVSANKGQIVAARLKAKKGAAAKLANDPKQYAKEQIYKAWIEWREGRAQYGKRNSQAAFASAMREKWDVIENVRSIENWCRDWKNGKNIPLIEPAQ